MSDTKPETEETKTTSEPEHNPWDDVLKDFQSLGQSITEAVQDALHEEKYKESLKELRHGLENTANQVAKSIDEAIQSSQTEEAKASVKKAAEDVKGVGDRVYSDTKPHLINALQSLNQGIQKLIDRLQAVQAESTATKADAETTSTEEEA